jgi:ornithine cyclodeaminase/alanine dehydrogenase-like protein (mu-crystallin family)
MTKHIEIATLDKFIAVLGDHSYLGPWLADNREAIVASIGNDHPVDILLPREAQRQAERLVADARQAADEIRDFGKRQAAEMRDRAQKQCDDLRTHVAATINRAADDAVRALAGFAGGRR